MNYKFYVPFCFNTMNLNKDIFSMHQSLDPDDAGWDLVKDWFDKDDDDDPTLEVELPEDYCKKCRGKMRLLNTGLRKKIYACPRCEKV